MEAYNASANATEMKNTTDSLVKLHGLGVPDTAPQVNININGTKQLERMTDDDLFNIAGTDLPYLEPTGTSGSYPPLTLPTNRATRDNQ